MKEELKKFLDENLEDWVEEHLETWKDRYYRKSLSDIEYDLNINYDFSADIESVEQVLGRELSGDEKQDFIERYTQAIINNFY